MFNLYLLRYYAYQPTANSTTTAEMQRPGPNTVANAVEECIQMMHTRHDEDNDNDGGE